MQEENKEIFLLTIGVCLGMTYFKEAMMLLIRNDAPLGQDIVNALSVATSS